MDQETTQKSSPRLMQLPEDGNANKPEELEGLDITIVDALSTRMPDGRDSAKWVVRLPSGQTKLYWAAGQNPMLQVRDWFRTNPGTPLYARLYRQVNQYGTNVWKIEQREPEGHNERLTRSADAHEAGANTIDDQLAEVGL